MKSIDKKIYLALQNPKIRRKFQTFLKKATIGRTFNILKTKKRHV